MQPFCQNPQLSRSLESELESAVKSGELKLQSKNLKDFPNCGDRYNLKDTVIADLSRNKLIEVPGECTDYPSLERLLLYHNVIKSIPDTISTLKSLQYLDISRNQLTYLPASVCLLTQLQCLVANNNKLVSLPEEIGEMSMLMELDVSCNEIAHLPVQIGDLANLRSLHLRRNHLQEIPVELTYLQLNFLDLAANRLSSLPVELRFMVTLVDLYLEENPLTCPPANLCGRGRVHIFKYLEVQAIKEDKKRGVLTDGEYRRSYRKTSQLNDMRFGGGLSADARRKRNTADSGYGSEQPLDRRWSQEFTQEGEQPHAEDARRLAHRVISHRPASHMSPVHPSIKPTMFSPQQSNLTSSHHYSQNNQHSTYTHSIQAQSSPGIPNYKPHPSLTSHGSSGGSSGVSSLGSSSNNQQSQQSYIQSTAQNLILSERGDSALGTDSTTSPTNSIEIGVSSLTIQDCKTSDTVDGRDKGRDTLQEDKVQKQSNISHFNGNGNSNGFTHGAKVENGISHSKNVTINKEENVDDPETEETRRTSQRVFNKQGIRSQSRPSCPRVLPSISSVVKRTKSDRSQRNNNCSRVQPRPVGRLPLPTASGVSTSTASSASGRSGPSSPNSSGLPSPTPNNKTPNGPSIQTYKQFKEQQRLNRQGEGIQGTYCKQINSASSNHTKGELLKQTDGGSSQRNSAFLAGPRVQSQQKSSHTSDIKSVQKEAVMSYLDRMGQNTGNGLQPRAGAPPDTSPPPPPTSSNGANSHASNIVSPRHNQSFISQGSKTTTTSSNHQFKSSSTSIPSISRGAGNTSGNHSTSRGKFGSSAANGIGASNTLHNQTTTNPNFTVRREADRTAIQDTHIHHLRQQIESRLKVSLGEDLPSSLMDGVVLCHIANHVSPRSVSSIHVPSPAVPKLTAAKCRRNVDNFLAACRKIGVREDLICSVSDVMEPKKTNTVRVAITVSELLRHRGVV